jgi:hypothetical protein
MLLGDVLTLKQLNLLVELVVFNNSSLGFVELERLLDSSTRDRTRKSKFFKKGRADSCGSRTSRFLGLLPNFRHQYDNHPFDG